MMMKYNPASVPDIKRTSISLDVALNSEVNQIHGKAQGSNNLAVHKAVKLKTALIPDPNSPFRYKYQGPCQVLSRASQSRSSLKVSLFEMKFKIFLFENLEC